MLQRLGWTVRSLLLVLWMSITVVPWGTAMVILSIFIRGTPLYWATIFWVRMAMWGVRTITGVVPRVSGIEHLPDGPVILAPKHQSTWETFYFTTLMPRPLCYVFKRELLWVPFFGWAMSRLDMVHIDRRRRTEAWNKVAEQGGRFMRQGNWVIMFPEGTRTARGSQGVYKNGATRLAVATGVPVLPIAVASARCWPRGAFILRPGIVDVSIGKPIPSVGREPDELMREVEGWIESEMRRIDPEAYEGVPARAPRTAQGTS
ncbi:lysophospholipid acyltransferase family protein [Ideonella sp. BN130291]|uniref:lysophospholipid acyltransferase family protein n=1 Tax=Ideonella sp. BN130291 TaxID=3112940 RepID=UPI002E25D4C5|nr:lysophospholipid acyltransferase family protein [Ideonella sp. BN130291]